ncbi:type IV pilus modification PilV family protein, partial [Amphibiibacter pelophylacis]
MRHPAFRRKARGFSLIEALITVAVFSIGLLGVAMTQYTALREQRNAQDFGSANEGMGYIAERMHINSAALDTPGSYTLTLAGTRNCTDDPNPSDPQEKQDIVRWQQMLCNAFGPGNVQAALQPVRDQPKARWAMVV